MLLELWQAHCCDRCPGGGSSSAGPLETEIQLRSPLSHLQAVPLASVVVGQGAISACPSAPPGGEAVEHHEVSAQSLLWTEDFSCSSYVFPSGPYAIFVAILWTLSNSFMSFSYWGDPNCTPYSG